MSKNRFIGQNGIKAPDPVTITGSGATDNAGVVEFTAPTNVGGAPIIGYRATTTDGSIGVDAGANDTRVGLTGLNTSTTYGANISAINAFGWSSPVEASFTTLSQANYTDIIYDTPGTYNFVVPAGVTSVSAIAVGGGGGNQGGGGALAYRNNIPVTPLSLMEVVVGDGGNTSQDGEDSSFSGMIAGGGTRSVSSLGSTGGQPSGIYDGGGSGGSNTWTTISHGGGGGAGGYSGNGGNGGTNYLDGTAGTGGAGGGGYGYAGAGGGVGLHGLGASGFGGDGTSAETSWVEGPAGWGGSGGQPGALSNTGNPAGYQRGGLYGGGGSGMWNTSGAHGAVRIVWRSGSAFPSTNVGVEGQLAFTTPGSYTWIAPEGVRRIGVVVVGGGGGGGCTQNSGSSGGTSSFANNSINFVSATGGTGGLGSGAGNTTSSGGVWNAFKEGSGGLDGSGSEPNPNSNNEAGGGGGAGLLTGNTAPNGTVDQWAAQGGTGASLTSVAAGNAGASGSYDGTNAIGGAGGAVGGGGGGARDGAGGGGGAISFWDNVFVTPNQSYTVTVGEGGQGGQPVSLSRTGGDGADGGVLIIHPIQSFKDVPPGSPLRFEMNPLVGGMVIKSFDVRFAGIYNGVLNGGGIVSYRAISNNQNISGVSATQTVTLSGLTPGVSHTFDVSTSNGWGFGKPRTTPSVPSFFADAGDAVYDTAGTYTWVAPSGVDNVSVVAIGAGGTGGAYGGAGGCLVWKNNIQVTSGQSYTIEVGATNTDVNTSTVVAGSTKFSTFLEAFGGYGGYVGGFNLPTQPGVGYDGGGRGGKAGSDSFSNNLPSNRYRTGTGGGAGGYSGNGGNGAGNNYTNGSNGSGGGGGGGAVGVGSNNSAGGGGVGLYGEGPSGVGGIPEHPTNPTTSGGKGGSGGGDGLNKNAAGNGPSGGLYGGGSSGSASSTQAYGGDGALRILWGAGRAYPSTDVAPPEGNQEYITLGTYSWVAPNNVNSVSVVAIGGGGGAGTSSSWSGGGGGGLGWKNNISVTPSQSYTVVVGDGGIASSGSSGTAGGNSYFIDTNTVAGFGGAGGINQADASGGGYVGDGGGAGGISIKNNNAGGGGAGGYSGNGGNSNTTTAGSGSSGSGGGGGGGGHTGPSGNAGHYSTGGGGGVGIYGEGPSGAGGIGNSTTLAAAGKGGSYGANGFTPSGQGGGGQGGLFGGGGGSFHYGYTSSPQGNGARGAIRIVWGLGKVYPNNALFDGGQIYSTAGTYSFIIPPNTTSLDIEAVGGGGGGKAGGGGGSSGSGGLAGTYNTYALASGSFTPGDILTVVVGAGGLGGSGNGANGSVGNLTTITGSGISLTLTGGNAGGNGPSTTSGGTYSPSGSSSSFPNSIGGAGGWGDWRNGPRNIGYNPSFDAKDGTLGAGGGGGGSGYNTHGYGGDGGDGAVKISWTT